jgi:hypothetical protein
MDYKEPDVENLIAVGYLTGVVDAFSKSMNISAEDMKNNMMKSDTIRRTLVDSLGSTDVVGLVKKSREIASRVLHGDNTADTTEPPAESLLQRAEHAIASLFTSSKPATQEPQTAEPVVTGPEVPLEVSPEVTTPEVPPAVTTPEVPPAVTTPEVPPAVTTPEVPPAVTTPEVPPAVTTPEVPPEVPPAITGPEVPPEVPPVPNASAMNPMAPPPVSVGGRKKNKSRRRKSKKAKKTRK